VEGQAGGGWSAEEGEDNREEDVFYARLCCLSRLCARLPGREGPLVLHPELLRRDREGLLGRVCVCCQVCMGRSPPGKGGKATPPPLCLSLA
jgi:hypothetical protein